MLDFLFGWRKASKCKKLIKRTQCRLKLLKSKKFAVVRLVKEDIAQLLKNGHEHYAFNKLDQLYKDENILSIYEMLNTFSEFILLNLSYIRRHKDIPNDVNEAISTLIFASARFGDLPELRLVRKLFTERYGQRFVTAAVELYPGNLVNCQVKDKFSSQQVTQAVKNRMVDEIVRDYFFKPGQLAIEYKPDIPKQQEKVTEFTEVQVKDAKFIDDVSNCNNSIVLHSSSTAEASTHPKLGNLAQLNPPYRHKSGAAEVKRLQEQESGRCSSEKSAKYPEKSIVHLDDVVEFKSPNNQGMHCQDQDQRLFMFKVETPNHGSKDSRNVAKTYPETMYVDAENVAKKRMRRRSVSKENKTVTDAQREIYYSSSPNNRRKYQKKAHVNEMDTTFIQSQSNKKHQTSACACKLQCSLDQPCYYFHANENRGYDILLLKQTQDSIDAAEYSMVLATPLSQTPKRCSMDSSTMKSCGAFRPCRAVTMSQRQEKAISEDFRRTSSLTVENDFMEFTGSRNSASPRYVHPKLPDYDEIAAKFRALKKAHQLIKSSS